MRVLVSEKLSPHRFKTPEGYLICTDAILARTGKQTYRRREVFGDMSDKGEEEIEINRDEKEVFDPATLASFENKPLTIEHPNEDVNPENHHDYAVGFTRDIKRGKTDQGEDVMLGTIVVTDAEAIKDIESGELVELSCGYDCDVVDEANPQQRNIRGNHVALCERGRAGIARIVDSVKDVNDLTKFKMALRNISKMYSNDPGIEYVTSVLRNLGYEVTVDSIDGWRENKNVPGEHIKKYRMNVTLDGKEHHFLVELYADMGEWKVKEINAYMLDSTSDALKLNNCSGYAIVEKKKFDQYGINANVEVRTDSLTEAKYMAGRYNSQGGYYVVINCKTMKMEDSMKDEDFSKKTKQGFTVVEMYRDGGRLHAIVKRSSDYVVALGYDTSDGTWAQGRYVNTYGNALATLLEEKPSAKKIQDAVKDAKTEYVFNWHDTYHGTKDKTRVDANSIKEAIKKFGDIIALGGVGTANCYVISISPNDGYLRAYGKLSDLLKTFKDCDTKDSCKKFAVKYTKDSKTYIQIVKANDLTDAVNKVKSQDVNAVPFESQSEVQAAMREIEPLYERVYHRAMHASVVPWRYGYKIAWERSIPYPFELQHLVGDKYVLSSLGAYKGKYL